MLVIRTPSHFHPATGMVVLPTMSISIVLLFFLVARLIAPLSTDSAVTLDQVVRFDSALPFTIKLQLLGGFYIIGANAALFGVMDTEGGEANEIHEVFRDKVYVASAVLEDGCETLVDNVVGGDNLRCVDSG